MASVGFIIFIIFILFLFGLFLAIVRFEAGPKVDALVFMIIGIGITTIIIFMIADFTVLIVIILISLVALIIGIGMTNCFEVKEKEILQGMVIGAGLTIIILSYGIGNSQMDNSNVDIPLGMKASTGLNGTGTGTSAKIEEIVLQIRKEFEEHDSSLDKKLESLQNQLDDKTDMKKVFDEFRLLEEQNMKDYLKDQLEEQRREMKKVLETQKGACSKTKEEILSKIRKNVKEEIDIHVSSLDKKLASLQSQIDDKTDMKSAFEEFRLHEEQTIKTFFKDQLKEQKIEMKKVLETQILEETFALEMQEMKWNFGKFIAIFLLGSVSLFLILEKRNSDRESVQKKENADQKKENEDLRKLVEKILDQRDDRD